MGGNISFESPDVSASTFSYGAAPTASFATSYAWGPDNSKSFGIRATIGISTTSSGVVQPYLSYVTRSTTSGETLPTSNFYTTITCSTFPNTEIYVGSILCPVANSEFQPGTATLGFAALSSDITSPDSVSRTAFTSSFASSYAFVVASTTIARKVTTSTATKTVMSTTPIVTTTVCILAGAMDCAGSAPCTNTANCEEIKKDTSFDPIGGPTDRDQGWAVRDGQTTELTTSRQILKKVRRDGVPTKSHSSAQYEPPQYTFSNGGPGPTVTQYTSTATQTVITTEVILSGEATITQQACG